MIIKPTQARSVPSFLVPFAQSNSANLAPRTHYRCLHQSMRAAPIPPPTPFVPDAQTFLTLIGRNLSQHASKIPSWKALFSLTSAQLKDLGIEPPRSRRYLLRWREKFRHGQFGIGGDIKFVEDGAAQLRVLELPASTSTTTTSTTSLLRTKRIVVNVGGSAADPDGTGEMVPVRGLQIKGVRTIVGPHVQPLKGGQGAKIEIKEGLWEQRRGHKVDGGERRQAEVRAKRRGEAKRAAR